MTKDHDWENPQVVGRNKEPGRVPLIPYVDEASALADERETSPYFRSLNGDWKFQRRAAYGDIPQAAPNMTPYEPTK